MAQLSGLADYFEQKRRDGGTTLGWALQRDFSWNPADVVAVTSEQLQPKFRPRAPKARPSTQTPTTSNWAEFLSGSAATVSLKRRPAKSQCRSGPLLPGAWASRQSGASVALMSYCPEWDLYVAGTVNQVEQPLQSFQLTAKALDVTRLRSAPTPL